VALCTDTYTDLTDEYVGHDEPSLIFKSDQPGSANDISYDIRLPKEPTGPKPKNDGSGSVWNFMLRPTFWFGLTLCDSESSPEYTHDPCVPDTDANDFTNTDPNAPDYIGKHPGNAYMELQFYGPGYVPQFTGFGCSAHQYCAAMTIDSLTLNQNTNKVNNPDCDNYILGGIEPINWAYITKSGESQAPANPIHTGTFSNPNLDAVTPDYFKDLMMNPGDRIHFRMHDTPAGFRVDMTDVTTGESGSMTASIANGFGHILFRPGASTCKMKPYAFHPEYSTADTRGNTWSAHTYNVAYSDEIGHFEHCTHVDPDTFNCDGTSVEDPGGLDEDNDNNFCIPGSFSTVVKINGCFSADEDFDGPSYQNDWPGSNPDPATDKAMHPTPVLFSSPKTNNGQDPYPTIAFETDLPRIEAADSQDNPPFCDRTTGAGCVNPPVGADWYPIYSTVQSQGCKWAEGGQYIDGATYDYGSNSTEQYGPLLQTPYPTPAGISYRYNNFNSGDLENGCP
jgi:hypothetical protein